MNKAHCSRAGKALATKQTSSAGKALAQCRWGKKKSTAKPKAKPKAKAKASAPTRRSRRLAGKTAETVRQPEPKKKAPRKAAKKKAPKRSAKSKKVENILVPGLNPPRGDMRNFLEQQRQLYGG